MINISCLQSWTWAVWAFKNFLYTNPSFLSISAGFAGGQCCQHSRKDASSWLLCLSQFCLCPLGVRLLSAQSPVPGISRRAREYEKPELVWLFWDSVLPVGPTQKGQTGCCGVQWDTKQGLCAGFVPGFTSWDPFRATAHPWAAE